MVDKILLKYNLKKKDLELLNCLCLKIEAYDRIILIIGKIFDDYTQLEDIRDLESLIDKLKRVNGSFSAIIIDDGCIYLISDHANSKILFYTKIDETITISTTLKDLVGDNYKLNREGIEYFLTYMLIPNDLTFYQDVYKTEPGKMVLINRKHITKKRYFSLSEKIDKKSSEKKQLRQVRRELEMAVDRRIDLSCKTHISLGGLDSGVLVGLIAKRKSNVHTYSIGFDEEFNDLQESRNIAKHNGTNHHEMLLSENDLDNYYNKTVGKFDMPSILDFGAMVTNPIFEKIQGKSQFVSGEGADPVFGGIKNDRLFLYNKYITYGSAIRPFMRLVGEPIERYMNNKFVDKSQDVSKLKKTAHGKSKESTIEKIRKQIGFFVRTANITEREKYPSRIYAGLTSTFFFDRGSSNDLLYYYKKNLTDKKMNFMNRLMKINIEIKSYHDHLYRNEQLGKIHSVNNSTPYLDKELILNSFTIPVSRKYELGKNKIFLAKATQDLFPKELQFLPKRGFATKATRFFNDYYEEKYGDIKESIKGSNILDENAKKILFRKVSKNNEAKFNMWDSNSRIFDHLALSFGKWEGLL